MYVPIWLLIFMIIVCAILSFWVMLLIGGRREVMDKIEDLINELETRPKYDSVAVIRKLREIC